MRRAEMRWTPLLLGTLMWLAGRAAAGQPADRGVFPDLDPRVRTRIAPWLPRAPAALHDDPARGLTTLYLDGLPVKVYALEGGRLADGDRRELERALGRLPERTRRPARRAEDADRDGIPDPVDVLRGAHKTVLNGATYREGYQVIAYPGGDVPRDRGVCTDVVVRALRNAGIDLQPAVYRDMRAHPARYGLRDGRRPNRNIEHRRVRRLIRYFLAHHAPLPTTFDPEARGRDAWLPGDIVFMDTFPSRAGPDHVGLVADRADAEGRPLIVNNWTVGYTTREMALLDAVPVTHRFRIGLKR